MVQAVMNLAENSDRVLTIIKGKYGLKNKSEAVNLIISQYEQELLEPQLRPEYETKILKMTNSKGKKYSSITQLRADIENA